MLKFLIEYNFYFIITKFVYFGTPYYLNHYKEQVIHNDLTISLHLLSRIIELKCSYNTDTRTELTLIIFEE